MPIISHQRKCRVEETNPTFGQNEANRFGDKPPHQAGSAPSFAITCRRMDHAARVGMGEQV